MSLRRFLGSAFGLGALAFVAWTSGCGGSDDEGTGSSGTGTPSGATGGNPSTAPCYPTKACTSVPSDCMALVDNRDEAKFGLRFSQLEITAPSTLADGAVGKVVSDAVTLKKEECNLAGTGTFSWIMQFDTAAGTVKTGGAKVSTPEAGYCFVNESIVGNEVTPITAEIGDLGKPFEADVDKVNVPVFLDTTGESVVLLKLHEAKLTNAQLSNDHNCIGKYNAEQLDPQNLCLEDPATGVKPFTAGGSLEGYITLDEADEVPIDILPMTLCVLLSGDAKNFGDDADGSGPEKATCKRDAEGQILFRGDSCYDVKSGSVGPATKACANAVKLAADFAASAVKINGDCN